MNKALFYGAYSRASSYFQNTEYAARQTPDAEELALLMPMKADLPPEVFTSVYQPPRSRGDGFDRTNLLQADALLKQAGWVLKNQRRINAVTGKPLRFELLLPSGATIAGCCRSSIISSASVLRWIFAVDNSQYSNRRRSRDYDMMPIVWRATPRPGTDLQISRDSSYIHSSYNAPGVQSPVVDKLIAQIIRWQGNKQKLLPTGRALDRVLTRNYYMLPMWYMAQDRTAYWDKFSFPQTRPVYSSGFDTRWYDVNKAAKLPADKR